MQDFKNLTQLFDFFKDEENYRDYLEQQRWNANIRHPQCKVKKFTEPIEDLSADRNLENRLQH
jgi:hypothetical protein